MSPLLGMRGARQFLEGFLPEWLEGSPAPVRTPLGVHEVRTAIHLLEVSGVSDRTVRARARLALRLVPEVGSLAFTPDDLRLAVVVYNLLALGHPALERIDARPGGEASGAIYTASLLEQLEPPRDLEGALRAHTLVGRLFEAERQDSEVKTWLATHRFRGRPVPKNITRFRRLRRVRVHGRRVEGLGLLDSEDQFILLDRLLLRSPLSDLLHPERGQPAFRLAGLARWLGHPDLCRSLLYAWVDRDRPAEIAEALAQALHVRVRGMAPREEVLLVAHALYHLHLLLLTEGLHRKEPPVSVADLAGRWRARSGSLFVALILALRQAAGSAGLPPDEDLGEGLAERQAAFDRVARSAVDEEARERAAIVLAAILGQPIALPGTEAPALPPPSGVE
ncbi:MAG: hypothetical protein P1V51_06045 [Deltaproteobacteria bacterium]|nr:hypothetical protein [Deltaproteobacteria bacterium]